MKQVEDIAEKLIKYVELRSELIKIQAKEQVTEFATSLVLFFIMLFILLLILITGSVVLGIYLNNVLESKILGFGIIIILQLLFFIVIYKQRHGIVKAVIYKFVFEEHLKAHRRSDNHE